MHSNLFFSAYISDIELFLEYVCEFYNNEDGIYPIATREQIADAVSKYLASKNLEEIEFDSYDREMVRTLIDPNYSLL